MPNTTSNFGFNLFLENDIVDYQQINSNFSTIDNLPLAVSTGSMDSLYSYNDYSGSAQNGTATWRYKRYADNTIELNTAFNISLLGVSNGSSAPYYSNQFTLALPTTLNSIYWLSVKVTGDNRMWSSMVGTSLSNIKSNGIIFRVVSDTKKSSSTSMVLLIELKGVE